MQKEMHFFALVRSLDASPYARMLKRAIMHPGQLVATTHGCTWCRQRKRHLCHPHPADGPCPSRSADRASLQSMSYTKMIHQKRSTLRLKSGKVESFRLPRLPHQRFHARNIRTISCSANQQAEKSAMSLTLVDRVRGALWGE